MSQKKTAPKGRWMGEGRSDGWLCLKKLPWKKGLATRDNLARWLAKTTLADWKPGSRPTMKPVIW